MLHQVTTTRPLIRKPTASPNRSMNAYRPCWRHSWRAIAGSAGGVKPRAEIRGPLSKIELVLVALIAVADVAECDFRSNHPFVDFEEILAMGANRDRRGAKDSCGTLLPLPLFFMLEALLVVCERHRQSWIAAASSIKAAAIRIVRRCWLGVASSCSISSTAAMGGVRG